MEIDSVTAKDVFDAVKAGDQAAIEIAKKFGRYLGHGLASVSALVDPSIFVIEVKFALAELGNDAGIYGAAKLVL